MATARNRLLDKFSQKFNFKSFKGNRFNFCKNLINNFDNEIENFFQVCPKEMLDKLDNPISLNKNLSVAI